MSEISFVSSFKFPDDEYTKELVYLCLDGKYRVAYVRKQTKTGSMFWAVASIGATSFGKKEFYPAFIQDSKFLENDIQDFLIKRPWETRPNSMDEVAAEASLTPF